MNGRFVPHSVVLRRILATTQNVQTARQNSELCGKSKEKEKPKPPPPPPKLKTFKIYKYCPQSNKTPHMKTYVVDLNSCGVKILDALHKIKSEQDTTLTFRRSCREGVCGSCAINVDGHNKLACLATIKPTGLTTIYPLPHMYVIKDLVVDFRQFLKQHDRIKPYLIRQCGEKVGEKQYLQSMKDRDELDGYIECILCACCSTSCPEYWWHGHTKDKNDFLGPSALLNANRWLLDSRDQGTEERLDDLRNYYAVYRCHTIMNCTAVCPKGLNPGKAIANLRLMLGGMKAKNSAEFEGMANIDAMKCDK